MPSAETAQTLAEELVGRGLAACVQSLGPMTSVYTWEGETEQATEWLLLAKTTAGRFEELSAVVVASHPYETPEVVAVPITHALAAYGAWVQEAVGALSVRPTGRDGGGRGEGGRRQVGLEAGDQPAEEDDDDDRADADVGPTQPADRHTGAL